VKDLRKRSHGDEAAERSVRREVVEEVAVSIHHGLPYDNSSKQSDLLLEETVEKRRVALMQFLFEDNSWWVGGSFLLCQKNEVCPSQIQRNSRRVTSG
jgi:hypothetical protein